MYNHDSSEGSGVVPQVLEQLNSSFYPGAYVFPPASMKWSDEEPSVAIPVEVSVINRTDGVCIGPDTELC